MQRLAVLSGGIMAGQILILLASPVLTRLYSPAEFGVYAVFTALIGIVANVFTLRFEIAVPVAASDRQAAGFAALAVVASGLGCLLSLPVLWLGASWLSGAMEMPKLAVLLWVLPLATFVQTIAETLSFWTVYRGTFQLNALGRAIHGGAQSVAQVALGLIGFSATGLIAGFVLGYLTRLLHLVRAISPADRELLRGTPPADLAPLLRKHWHYPAYATPATLLEAGTQLLPALLLATLYGPAVAGWFGLGQRLMGLPVRLLSQAARQVFMAEAARRSRRSLYHLFLRLSMVFCGLAIIGLLPVLFFGPEIFSVLFGEAWRTSGEMVRLLVPLYLTRFVVTPVSHTLNVLGRQNVHLISSSLDACFLAGGFAAAWWLDLSPLTTILVFSLGSTTAYLVYFILAWRVARAAAANSDAQLQSSEAVALGEVVQ